MDHRLNQSDEFQISLEKGAVDAALTSPKVIYPAETESVFALTNEVSLFRKFCIHQTSTLIEIF